MILLSVLLAVIVPALCFQSPVLPFCGLTQEASASERVSETKEEDSGDSVQTEQTYQTDFGYTVDRQTFQIPGLDRVYRLLLVSDLHIIVPDDPEVDDDKKEEVLQRRDEMFLSPEGETADRLWQTLPAQLDSMGADMILFAGDMIDFDTKASTSALKEGFGQLNTPWMYVRGDHDYGAWYSRTYETQKDAIALQKQTAPRKKVMKKAVGKLTVIGWDNNTSQMTEKGLRDLKTDLQAAKKASSPVLFLCHVPLKGTATDALETESLAKNGRALIWGDGNCYYSPDETTQQVLDTVLADDSPVALEASGHLHFSYSGPLNGHSSLVVAPPAFQKCMTELILTPEASGN